MFRENLTPALAMDASRFVGGSVAAGIARLRLGSPFCTTVHSFPQPNFQIPLAKKNGRVYSLPQIEPGSLKNLTAQLKEGAAAARPLRPQFFWPRFWRGELYSSRPATNRFIPSRAATAAQAKESFPSF